MTQQKVKIIGGGVAGLSTAVYLLQNNVPIQLFEQSPYLGGRARQVIIPNHTIDIDNGQHIILGAYKQFIEMVLFLNPRKKLNDLFYIQPLSFHVPDILNFQANSMNDLVSALCSATGLSWQEKLQFAKLFFYCRHLYDHSDEYNLANENVRNWLNQIENLSDKLKKFIFEPLCVASMNTPPDQANAQVFLNILRDSLFTFRSFKTSLMMIPKVNLTELFVNPAVRYIQKQGGDILINQGIKHLSELNYHDDLIVSAVSPYRLTALISDIEELSDVYHQVNQFTYEAITTVYVQFDCSLSQLDFNDIIVMLPILDDIEKEYGWWIINKEITSNQVGLIAIVLSAVNRYKKRNIEELSSTLTKHFSKMTADRIQFHKIITEKRATLHCNQNIQRPHYTTPLNHFFITGDYIDDDYSATLETALRNSKKVADRILAKNVTYDD